MIPSASSRPGRRDPATAKVAHVGGTEWGGSTQNQHGGRGRTKVLRIESINYRE